MISPPYKPLTLLLYEPRTEGHHLAWLRLITEDLCSAGFQLALAVDLRPSAKAKLHDQLGPFIQQLPLFNAFDVKGGKIQAVAHCLKQSGMKNVFLCSFDEIASSCWRRAAFGILPPPELHGRIGGIYHRPRFRIAPSWSLNQRLKQAGFRRLLNRAWFRQLVFLDEYVTRDCQVEYPKSPIFFVPDPCLNADDGGSAVEARRQLGIPPERLVLLFYGTGSRRKGLHLAVEAFQQLPLESPAFLLCVGQQSTDSKTAGNLKRLELQGRAHVINRYVSTAEEQLSFAACDMVLLPYVGHFGISSVFSQAMGANKPVIASDENLLGRLVREHAAGLWFRSGKATDLCHAIQNAAVAPSEDWLRWRAAARTYAERHSRAAFRAGLVAAVAGQD